MGTITDLMLENVSKAVEGSSYSIPNFLSVATTEVTNIATDAVALDGEIGTRLSTTISRSDNTITFTAIRTLSQVISSEGDTLRTSGLFTEATGDNLQVGATHNTLTQTSNFDLEFIYEIIVNRG